MKPMLFNTPMVRAILEGRKTQTRRIVKPQPIFINDIIYHHENGKWYISPDNDYFRELEVKTSYLPGDILYVRETWAKDGFRFLYRADYSDNEKFYVGGNEIKMRWKPSIHMPKEAARIFLRVIEARVERLKNIKAEDCVSEGAVRRPDYTKRHDLVIHGRYKQEFARLWESTLAPADLDRYGWNANPWVWVYKFERISKEEAYENI